ncbi:MAG TPA: hypothetical protein VL173_13410 [Vicinamibacterales bacterium]|nr:hypothetical protein [Vicinamibacterales bacterium]
MRSAILAAMMVLMLVPSLSAQDGLRSAPLREGPVVPLPPPPGPTDLFRATPETYGAHPPQAPPVIVTGGGVFYGGWPEPYHARGARADMAERSRFSDNGYLRLLMQPDDALVFVDGAYVGTVADTRRTGGALLAGVHRVELRANGYQSRTFDVRISQGETTTYREDLEHEVAAAPAASVRRATPKTFYVIPGCYAGDKMPSRESLPSGCDRAKLRAVPPVVAYAR